MGNTPAAANGQRQNDSYEEEATQPQSQQSESHYSQQSQSLETQAPVLSNTTETTATSSQPLTQQPPPFSTTTQLSADLQESQPLDFGWTPASQTFSSQPQSQSQSQSQSQLASEPQSQPQPQFQTFPSQLDGDVIVTDAGDDQATQAPPFALLQPPAPTPNSTPAPTPPAPDTVSTLTPAPTITPTSTSALALVPAPATLPSPSPMLTPTPALTPTSTLEPTPTPVCVLATANSYTGVHQVDCITTSASTAETPSHIPTENTTWNDPTIHMGSTLTTADISVTNSRTNPLPPNPVSPLPPNPAKISHTSNTVTKRRVKHTTHPKKKTNTVDNTKPSDTPQTTNSATPSCPSILGPSIFDYGTINKEGLHCGVGNSTTSTNHTIIDTGLPTDTQTRDAQMESQHTIEVYRRDSGDFSTPVHIKKEPSPDDTTGSSPMQNVTSSVSASSSSVSSSGKKKRTRLLENGKINFPKETPLGPVPKHMRIVGSTNTHCCACFQPCINAIFPGADKSLSANPPPLRQPTPDCMGVTWNTHQNRILTTPTASARPVDGCSCVRPWQGKFDWILSVCGGDQECSPEHTASSSVTPALTPPLRKEMLAVKKVIQNLWITLHSLSKETMPAYPVDNLKVLLHQYYDNKDTALYRQVIVNAGEVLLDALDKSTISRIAKELRVGVESVPMLFLPISNDLQHLWQTENLLLHLSLLSESSIQAIKRILCAEHPGLSMEITLPDNHVMPFLLKPIPREDLEVVLTKVNGESCDIPLDSEAAFNALHLFTGKKVSVTMRNRDKTLTPDNQEETPAPEKSSHNPYINVYRHLIAYSISRILSQFDKYLLDALLTALSKAPPFKHAKQTLHAIVKCLFPTVHPVVHYGLDCVMCKTKPIIGPRYTLRKDAIWHLCHSCQVNQEKFDVALGEVVSVFAEDSALDVLSFDTPPAAPSLAELPKTTDVVTHLIDEIQTPLEQGLCGNTFWETSWKKRFEVIREISRKDSFSIAFVGSTGSGKSKLINAILGCPVLPGKFCAEILFQSPLSFLRDITDTRHLESQNVDFSMFYTIHTSIATLQGVLKDRFYDEFFQYESLTYHADSSEHLRKLLIKLLTPHTGVNHTIWPIVKCAKIHGPFEDLQTGCTLVDLPGGNDTCSARSSILDSYMTKADQIWFVTTAKRAASCKTLQTLILESLGERMKAHVQVGGRLDEKLTVIVTKLDDFALYETCEILGLPKTTKRHDVALAHKQKIEESVLAAICNVSARLGKIVQAAPQVVAVSAQAYLDHVTGQSTDSRLTFKDLSETGIPSLKQNIRTFCQSDFSRLTATCGRLKELLSAMSGDLETAEQNMEIKLTEAVTTEIGLLRDNLKQYTIRENETFGFDNQKLLYKNKKSQLEANFTGPRLYASTCKAIVARDGVFREHNWNLCISSHFHAAIDWSKFFENVEMGLHTIQEKMLEVLKNYTIRMTNLLDSFKSKVKFDSKPVEAVLHNSFSEINKFVKHKQRFMLPDTEVTVKQALAHDYAHAKGITGTGMVKAIVGHMATAATADVPVVSTLCSMVDPPGLVSSLRQFIENLIDDMMGLVHTQFCSLFQDAESKRKNVPTLKNLIEAQRKNLDDTFKKLEPLCQFINEVDQKPCIPVCLDVSKTPVSVWTTEQVSAYLLQRNISQMACIILSEQGIDGGVLLTLTDEELAEIGVRLGDRKKLARIIGELKKSA
ncbi:hypothetical protein Pelo_4953 [Pelomyxa schiedti]|nr:hypothetical protein Pelo_4953 [Pelomyxa schiedti]